MGKKRKCHMNENEIAVHELAVKLRKKTDEQLVEAFQQIFDQGYQNGLERNKIPEGNYFVSEEAKNKFLASVQITPGIGKATYEKIKKIAESLDTYESDTYHNK